MYATRLPPNTPFPLYSSFSTIHPFPQAVEYRVQVGLITGYRDYRASIAKNAWASHMCTVYVVTPSIRYYWDLGYVSTVDCKLVARVGQGDDSDHKFCMVQAPWTWSSIRLIGNLKKLKFI